MKNYKKYVICSLILIFLVMATLGRDVSASATLMFGNNTTNNTVNTVNNTTNNTVNNVTEENNVTETNTINDNVTKDEEEEDEIPATGEYDLYIISTVGLVAVVVSAFAFAKSRKYNV